MIVLGSDHDDLVVASLPTSHNHIPDNLEKKHGCINNDSMCINCYLFEGHRIISDTGFSFPKDTFVYGEQVQSLSLQRLKETYPHEGINYFKLGNLISDEFEALKLCLSLSGNIKNKVRKYLK